MEMCPRQPCCAPQSPPALGVVSQKLPPAAGGRRIRARGPGALTLGRRRPHLPLGHAGPPGRGEGVPPPRGCLRPEQGRGPRGAEHRSRSAGRAPGRESPRLAAGPTSRRPSEVRRGGASPSTGPSASVCQSVHSRPRVPTGGAGVGAGPLRPRGSRPASRSTLTRPAGDVQPPRVPATSVPTRSGLEAPRLRSSDPVSAPRCHHARARARAGRPRGMLGAEVLRVRWVRASAVCVPRDPASTFSEPSDLRSPFLA